MAGHRAEIIDNQDQYSIRVVSISPGSDEEIPYETNLVNQAAAATDLITPPIFFGDHRAPSW